MYDDLHLPWDRDSLEALAKRLVVAGETTKVDLKSIFELSGVTQQGEFLKDVSAIANTHDHNLKDHGMLIFGASKGTISHTSFPADEDHLQATIDDLLKKYIRPFITTRLFIYTDNEKQWGVVVVPPTRNAPHVFCNDIHKRYRGEIYVRYGTTTEKAQPEDYSRFFRQHLEEHTYGFQQSINDLQREVATLSIQSRKMKSIPVSRNGKKVVSAVEIVPAPILTEVDDTVSVTDRINILLTKEEDKITHGLLEEVKKIQAFIESYEIPWNISVADKAQSKEIMTKIETVCSEFWSAIISLISRDEKGTYDDALIKAITYLSRTINSPTGAQYTDWGKNVRYYPLLVALYLICIVGVEKKRDKLIRKILKIELQGRSHYDEPLSITYILFSIRNAAEVFQPLYDAYPSQRWCDPIASYTKTLIDRILTPDDPLWDKAAAFYRGEYILCIAPMDILERVTKKPMIGHPSSGSFLFINASEPVIARFLRQDRDWIKKLFERPLQDILTEFDQTAHRLSSSSSCWGNGFEKGALKAAFPDKTEDLK